jgi:hypothetical protein
MPETKQWEYRVQTIGSALGTKDALIETTLNEWGLEGWEAIHVYTPGQGSKVTIVAKRLLSASARRRASWPGE